MRRRWPFILLGVLLAAGTAQADTLVELEQPDLYDLQVIGFETSREGRVEIEAVGLWPRDLRGERSWVERFAESWSRWSDDDENELSVYAWILDAETRRPVWEMDVEESERESRGSSLRRVQDELRLDAGRYELYLFSGHAWLDKVRSDDWYEGSRRKRRQLEEEMEEVLEDLERCYVKVISNDIRGGDVRSYPVEGGLPGALISFTRLGDSQLVRQGFALDRGMSLRVYSLVEHPRDSMDAADFGWIVDAATGERVVDLSDRRGRRGGGGSKNRVIDDEFELPAGRYVLYYGTDDSHSYERFNVDPPYDPLNWGIQLLPGEGFQAASFSLFEVGERGDALIDFSRARDSDFYEQPFRLARETTLHVYALGEGVDDGWYFVDYGWIVDARTGDTVWEMQDRNTVPAGGAEKNRMFEGDLRLPAGDYIAFYITDDSHSWEDWNSAAPFDEEAWGMTIRGGEGFRDSDFMLLEEEQLAKDSGVIARIVRVGDHERRRERFSLSEQTRVEVYALGEGVRGEMYDYGWIRNRDNGRTVWEMDWRDTDHAGGASKNREVREVITLDAGEYEVLYTSDGSHSFEDWNDRRPDDPLNWGITLRRVD